MAFDQTQIKALSSKLNARHVKTRCTSNGTALSYIEGWHAIAEANRIFGFHAWDRQTIYTKCVWQGTVRQGHACSYIAQVRVVVRARDVVICREASGSGHGLAAMLGDAHESAIKEAETDATKRALVTFGNPFGLALYDPEQRGVRGAVGNRGERQRFNWVALSPDGQVIANHADAVQLCATLRRQLEEITDPKTLDDLWTRNALALELLRQNLPDLRAGGSKTHYADLLQALYQRRRQTAQANGENAEPVETLVGPISRPRRARDREHLRFVATLPCLVCGRAPSHPHHIRFAQPRAVGAKVSDEWVVPLCNMHHRAVHAVGHEQGWWQERGIDPLPEAERLWQNRSAAHRR
jgi:Rad52/22 family double-strand break repair protein